MPFVVVLDPGHGGVDSGAVAHGIVEAELVVDIAAELRQALIEWGYNRGLVIGETRGPKLIGRVGTGVRGQIAREANADLVISIHANAAVNQAARGCMVFYRYGDAVSREIAAEIQHTAPEALRRAAGPYPATQEEWPRVWNVLTPHDGRAAVLVECGFLTNPQDAAALKSPEVIAGVVASMVGGVRRAMELQAARQVASR